MTGRLVNQGIRLLAAVALLLAVMSSPVRPPTSHSAPPPNYLPRNFAILETGHGAPFAPSARLSLREGESLPSEIEDEWDVDVEDELTVTSPPTSVPFGVLPAPCPERHPGLVSFAVAHAVRPLRC